MKATLIIQGLHVDYCQMAIRYVAPRNGQNSLYACDDCQNEDF